VGLPKRKGGLAAFVRRRIFVKYIFATLVVGMMANALVLILYYEYQRAKQTGQVAAEIATVALRVAKPAAKLVQAGDTGRASELIGVFSGFPYAICADLRLEGHGDTAASWPVVGCNRIKKPGRDVEVPLQFSGPGSTMVVRIDPVILASDLRAEVLVVVALGAIGGIALIVAAAVAFLWFINRPMSQLLSAIERFEQHDDPQKVRYQSQDEIGRVVSGYNVMLDRETERVSTIREAHRSILDSVTYATRIQQGLLPTYAQLSSALGETGVIWQPRDLVGGDIYWIYQCGKQTTVAVIDCTGHGVPGGFMSMLAIATLERIYSEDETLGPAQVLTRLSDLTRGLLNQDTGNPASNDGMDAAICRIDRSTGDAIFAGAHLSMMLVVDGKVKRIRGDNTSLGYADTPSNPKFTEHTFRLDGIQAILIPTDGIIDQLGGPKRIAFGYRRLTEVLQASITASPEGILHNLMKSFEEYTSQENRLDDVTVLAFTVGRS
jgi:serine phosphatase RsbU (regulator of sigma subunit)